MEHYALFETLQAPIWIYDLDKKNILWANKKALRLWETESLSELVSRNLGESMSEAVEVMLDDYRAAFVQKETIRTWWHFTPKTIEKRALCLFSGMYLDDGRLAMLVQVLGEESSLRRDLAFSDGANLALLFNQKGEMVSANDAFIRHYGNTVSHLSDFSSTTHHCLTQWITSAQNTAVHDEFILTLNDEPHYFDVEGKWLEDKQQLLLSLNTITEQKKAWFVAKYQSEHDCLTGLYNRRGFLSYMGSSLIKQSSYTIFFLDLDGFKLINDSFGHTVGDALLQQVTERLNQCISLGMVLGRLGGDEFVIACTEDIAITSFTTQLISSLNQSFHIENTGTINVGCSIGSSHSSAHSEIEDVIKQAGLAMQKAKRNGRNQHYAFSSCLARTQQRTSVLKNKLKSAIENDELYLIFNPIRKKGTAQVIGFESSLGWKESHYGVIKEQECIDIAKSVGQIFALNEWIIRHSLRQLSFWQNKYGASFIMRTRISSHNLNTQLPSLIDHLISRYNIVSDTYSLSIIYEGDIFKRHQVINVLKDIQQLHVGLYVNKLGIECLPNQMI